MVRCRYGAKHPTYILRITRRRPLITGLTGVSGQPRRRCQGQPWAPNDRTSTISGSYVSSKISSHGDRSRVCIFSPADKPPATASNQNSLSESTRGKDATPSRKPKARAEMGNHRGRRSLSGNWKAQGLQNSRQEAKARRTLRAREGRGWPRLAAARPA